MQHRGLTVLPTLALAFAACNNLTPATTEETTEAPASSTGTTGTGTGTDATSDEPTTDEPTTQTPTGDPSTDPSGDPTGQTTDVGEDVSIYDVQGGKIAAGTVVTIKGVVVTSPVKLKDSKGTLFVEEPAGGEYSGIAVYMYDEVTAALDAPPGSVVDITATYEEFFDNSQLVVMAVGDIEVVGTDTIPAPAVVQAADIATGGAKAENYEGVLVQIDDATVTDPAIDIGQFEVEGGARVSDYFLFDLGMSPKPAAGDIYPSIVGPLLYSFDQFQIAPRSLVDLGGDPVDTTTGDTDTTTGGGETDTIYDLQMGKIKVLDPVKVEGVIATSGLTFKKDGFFVQDPMGGEYSGVFVYVGANAVTVAPGDVLTISGTADEFFTFTELKVAAAKDIVKTGTAPVPEPVVVAAADIATGGAEAEPYEGVLVQVTAPKVTTAIDMNGEFIVDGKLRVDDLFFVKADWVNPKVGDAYASITGPLAFNFDNSKLSPRTPADLVK
jgi:predicted extracellular nuclease